VPVDASVLWVIIQGYSAADNVILTCTSVSLDQNDVSVQRRPSFPRRGEETIDFMGECDLVFSSEQQFESQAWA
jgi:hypothetical protein